MGEPLGEQKSDWRLRFEARNAYNGSPKMGKPLEVIRFKREEELTKKDIAKIKWAVTREDYPYFERTWRSITLQR